MVWKSLYNFIIVPVMWSVFQLGGLFNDKIGRGIRGRANLNQSIERDVRGLKGRHRLWFHSSSLGEFEQAKPIISGIRKLRPDVDIIATFFSPSGYENSKSYKLASVISYLPFDSRRAVGTFVDIVRPTAVVFVRYDVWPNLIWALKERRIPVMIANATMKKGSARKLFLVRAFHRALYNALTLILTVSDEDKTSFQDFGLTAPSIEAIGDTRFDQVKIRSDDAARKHLLSDRVVAGKKVLVIGQSWGADDAVVLPALFRLQQAIPGLLAIVVPHEPTVQNLEQLEYRLEGQASSIRFSEMNDYTDETIVLIDSVGVLVPLYRFAHVAYVGGSFRQGVHNVLEPAAFGIPVIYGPKHTNSQEAIALAAAGGGFVVENEDQVFSTLHFLLTNETRRIEAGQKALALVNSNLGATGRVMNYLLPLLSPS